MLCTFHQAVRVDVIVTFLKLFIFLIEVGKKARSDTEVFWHWFWERSVTSCRIPGIFRKWNIPIYCVIWIILLIFCVPWIGLFCRIAVTSGCIIMANNKGQSGQPCLVRLWPSLFAMSENQNCDVTPDVTPFEITVALGDDSIFIQWMNGSPKPNLQSCE